MIPPEFRNYNNGDIMKYLTLPTWCALQLLISGIPEHPYAKWYPNLETWASKSPLPYRLIDFALILIISAFVTNVLLTSL